MIFRCLITENREHVGLHTVFDSVVDVTIQMNRQIRDRHQISSGINQHGFHAVSVTYHHAARQGKRTVKPWGTDHSAVALHVQAGVMTIRHEWILSLYFKRRTVAVACDDLVAGKCALRDLERNHRGFISRHIIFSARNETPFFCLLQFCISIFVQQIAGFFYHMKRAFAPHDKIEQLLRCIQVFHSFSPLHIFKRFFYFIKSRCLFQDPKTCGNLLYHSQSSFRSGYSQSASLLAHKTSRCFAKNPAQTDFYFLSCGTYFFRFFCYAET